MPKSNVTTAPIPKAAPLWARISVLSGLAFIVLLTLLHVIEPEFDPSWRFISEYALGRHGWVMALAFASLAVSATALLAAVLNQIRTVGGYFGIALLALSIVGFGLAAVFPTDPITATDATASGMVHSIGAALGGNVSAAAFFLSWSLTRNRAWRAERRTVGWAVLIACLTGVAATWAGILLAYDSYYWGSAHQSLPVSFFIVAVIFAAYLLSGLAGRRAAARPGDTSAPAARHVTRDQVAA